LLLIALKDVFLLDNTYKFSGGNISHINQKYMKEEIIMGKRWTFEKITNFCNSEK